MPRILSAVIYPSCGVDCSDCRSILENFASSANDDFFANIQTLISNNLSGKNCTVINCFCIIAGPSSRGYIVHRNTPAELVSPVTNHHPATIHKPHMSPVTAKSLWHLDTLYNTPPIENMISNSQLWHDQQTCLQLARVVTPWPNAELANIWPQDSWDCSWWSGLHAKNNIRETSVRVSAKQLQC